MSFISALEKEVHVAHTGNGAISNPTTYDAVLDFFSKSGALRGKQEDALGYFEKAFSENETLAMRARAKERISKSLSNGLQRITRMLSLET